MMRDFMGLSSNQQLAVVKEEITDSPNDSDFVGFTKGSGSHWPNLNKAPGLAHFMSVNSSQEDDKPKRVAAEDLFDSTHKRSIGESQNMAGVDFDRQRNVGGVPFTAAHPTLYSAGSVAGFTEFWNSAKASGSPAQLTVFYAGTVNVFEDISPERAQAIMFLAGNSVCPMASNAAQMNQFLPPSLKLAEANDNDVKQTMNAKRPSSAVSSPLSVSSHTGAQSGTGSTSNNELAQGKTLGASVSQIPTTDNSKSINTIRPVSIAALMQSAVPQARKASLARFLEKRKERVMNAAAPYDLGKKSSECPSPEWNGTNFNLSATSGMGCGSL